MQDENTQVGYLCNIEGWRSPLIKNSKLAKRVVSSTLQGETMSVEWAEYLMFLGKKKWEKKKGNMCIK